MLGESWTFDLLKRRCHKFSQLKFQIFGLLQIVHCNPDLNQFYLEKLC